MSTEELPQQASAVESEVTVVTETADTTKEDAIMVDAPVGFEASPTILIPKASSEALSKDSTSEPTMTTDTTEKVSSTTQANVPTATPTPAPVEPLLSVELQLVRCPRVPVFKTTVPLSACLRDIFTELHQAWPFGSSVPQVDVTHLTIVYSGKRYTVTSSEPEELNRPFSESMIAKLLIKHNRPMRGVAFIYEPTETELEEMRAREAGAPGREMCGGLCTIA